VSPILLLANISLAEYSIVFTVLLLGNLIVTKLGVILTPGPYLVEYKYFNSSQGLRKFKVINPSVAVVLIDVPGVQLLVENIPV
jgi:hypothetical protein